MTENSQLIEIGLYKDSKDSSESDNEDFLLRCEIRKSRRKNLMPQKAVQSEIRLSDFTESQECLPVMETLRNHSFEERNSSFKDIANSDSSSLSESEFLQNIYNDEIFRELQEHPVNEEILHELNQEDIFQNLQNNHVKNFEDDDLANAKEGTHSYRAVKCNMCEQVFAFRADFDKHYLESYGLSPVYTCTFCNKTAEKYTTFRSHCYRHITEGKFKCQDCSKGFNLKSLLHIHFLTKHTKSRPFSCEHCGKSFVTKPGLRIHQKRHKIETKEQYPCVICGKILHTRGGLTAHLNVHRLGRRFMCDLCGKTFTQKVNMQQHVKQHTGDKPHACEKCGKSFSERSHLSRHYSFHTDQRPYQCDVCQKMYKTERCLKVHSLVHASERPFVCTFCNKGFISSTKLKQHSNVHTGERPYECKYCVRTFTNYSNLLKHTRRKHKSEIKTDDCDKTEGIGKQNYYPNNATTTEIHSFNNTVINRHSTIQELGMEQNLVRIALPDEKFIISQQSDLSIDTIKSSLPCFQNTLPSHQSLIQHINQAALSNQLTDLLHPQHQSVTYESSSF